MLRVRQKRTHQGARGGTRLTKVEAVTVVLGQQHERREGRGGGAGGPHSSAMGSIMQAVFGPDDKYLNRNYVACYRHLDDTLIPNSSSHYRNFAVYLGGFEHVKLLIPTMFHDFQEFRKCWNDAPASVRLRITEIFSFTIADIPSVAFEVPRFQRDNIMLKEFNASSKIAREILNCQDGIVDPEFMSPRGREVCKKTSAESESPKYSMVSLSENMMLHYFEIIIVVPLSNNKYSFLCFKERKQ